MSRLYDLSASFFHYDGDVGYAQLMGVSFPLIRVERTNAVVRYNFSLVSHILMESSTT